MITESFPSKLSPNKFSLKFCGILPLDGPSTPWKRRFSNFLLMFSIFCLTCINAPVLHFIITANLHLEDVLDVLNVIAGALGAEFRMVFIALNRDKIGRLISTCEAMWLDASVSDRKIVFPWANWARLLSKCLSITWFFGVTLYVAIPVIKQFTPGVDVRSRSWPYQINMDATQSPRYEIFYVVQSICAYISNCSMIGCDAIGPFLTLHACGQLKLIRYWLLKISEDEKSLLEVRDMNEIVEETLKKSLRRHQIIMDFCAELEEVVCYANLANALGGMYMMAISAARLTKMQGMGMFKQFGPLFLAAGQLLLSCWPAEHLHFESTMVATALYSVPWYRCSPCVKKAVAFMMMRSQRPAKLTAGKFIAFSLATFSSIISTAVSVFMLLRSIDSVTPKP